MALVNRSLALSLVRFKNVKVYCTVLQPEKEVEPSQIQDAKGRMIFFRN
jgi:ribonuclease PH